MSNENDTWQDLEIDELRRKYSDLFNISEDMLLALTKVTNQEPGMFVAAFEAVNRWNKFREDLGAGRDFRTVKTNI